MGTRVVINPKTGMSETITDNSKELAEYKLRQTKKELRDMLDGNTQFHVDKLGPDKEKPNVPEQSDDHFHIPLDWDGTFFTRA